MSGLQYLFREKPLPVRKQLKFYLFPDDAFLASGFLGQDKFSR
jgi:hypothetical protein